MRSESPFLTPNSAIRHVETCATRCLARCCKQLGLDDVPLPVPVDQWIESPLGIRFGIADLSHLGKDVLGACFTREPEILVSESVLSHEPRFRFTCAHELGHLMLHAKIRRGFQDSDTAKFASNRPVERQADRFAAALLMPIPLLVRELFRICDARGLRRRECIVELMMDTVESEWLWKKCFLPAFTHRFSVSLTAVVHRFSDIRLLDRKPFLLPKHRERLLSPAEPGDPIASVRLVDGVPKCVQEKV
jgi:hypothetical protein